ncbi:glycosyl transferase family 1 [Halobacteriales archaeon SW_5_70_135]|nr:MAG: glycosyl transferase family 1 [Halobacteriales archaeon SW_5_70_135]
MGLRVVAFTDTYLPTVNGVTYTVRSWRDRWNGTTTRATPDGGPDATPAGDATVPPVDAETASRGRMDVVYPASEYDPDPGEYPVRSADFPFYDGFRVAAPSVPAALPADPDVVHAHTPFGLGLAALRYARRVDAPLVASYHTPAGEYAGYVVRSDWLADRVRGAVETYERVFLDRAAAVVAPSAATRRHVRAQVGVAAPVEVISNGVDVDRFRPVDATAFRARHDLPEGPLVGYTGRHGFEKNLGRTLDAVDGLDATVVFGGDGPARDHLRSRAEYVDADVRFLGFLDREELPAFYSALDAFLFPSPVETQGLVALEANACGTPVVGADAGALADTVDEGVTGYRFEPGDPEAFRAAIERTLAESDRLHETCLGRRGAVAVGRSVDRLEAVYRDVVDG